MGLHETRYWRICLVCGRVLCRSHPSVQQRGNHVSRVAIVSPSWRIRGTGIPRPVALVGSGGAGRSRERQTAIANRDTGNTQESSQAPGGAPGQRFARGDKTYSGAPPPDIKLAATTGPWGQRQRTLHNGSPRETARTAAPSACNTGPPPARPPQSLRARVAERSAVVTSTAGHGPGT